MSISVYGAIFIPIAFWIFLFRPKYLVPLMLVASAFVAAPVLEFSLGDFDLGIKPYYFAAVLLAIRALPVLLKYPLLKRGLEPSVSRIVGSFVGFWKWALVSAFVFPVVFKGLQVINPRAVDGDVAAAFALGGESSPLHWSFENLGQAAYLTLNLVAVLYVIGSRRSSGRTADIFGTLRGTIIVVSLIALLQGVVAWEGWSFPLLFFHSNAAYSTGYDEAIEGLRRVNSTFSEASYAGGFLAAAALGLLAARLRGGRVSPFVIALAVIGLILTTATTGYAAFVVGGILLFLYFARDSLRRRMTRQLFRKCLYSVLLVAGAAAVLLAADVPLRQAAMESTLGKVDTVSFFARVSVDVYSMKLLVSTYGLGAGLGSNRPSSLGAYLLSNVGVVGSVLFVLFVFRLIVQLSKRARLAGGSSFAMVMWMLAGILVAQSVALPDLSWPPLWGILISAVSLLVSRNEIAPEGVRAGVFVAAQRRLPASPAAA
ncbi:MAG TPA: hypothetical protein VMG82_31700 [Candidatus Sulfotelmatobacter sp.]|nr:hypothetical protein [Candidatus Sulfotelmatobacter sp.]HUI73489.1 hypothetical protein [Candidatus Acidoferrum sp.]